MRRQVVALAIACAALVAGAYAVLDARGAGKCPEPAGPVGGSASGKLLLLSIDARLPANLSLHVPSTVGAIEPGSWLLSERGTSLSLSRSTLPLRAPLGVIVGMGQERDLHLYSDGGGSVQVRNGTGAVIVEIVVLRENDAIRFHLVSSRLNASWDRGPKTTDFVTYLVEDQEHTLELEGPTSGRIGFRARLVDRHDHLE